MNPRLVAATAARRKLEATGGGAQQAAGKK